MKTTKGIIQAVKSYDPDAPRLKVFDFGDLTEEKLNEFLNETHKPPECPYLVMLPTIWGMQTFKIYEDKITMLADPDEEIEVEIDYGNQTIKLSSPLPEE